MRILTFFILGVNAFFTSMLCSMSVGNYASIPQ